MAIGFKLMLVVTLVAVGLGLLKFSNLFKVPQAPELENTWWGLSPPGKEDVDLKPFKVSVSEEVLKDLKNRLRNTRASPPPLEGVHQNYGMTSNLKSKIVDFWLNKYDWKDREKLLNQYPQFKTSIQGLNIHFIHVKPKVPKEMTVLPLLLVHGWPGSVKEFHRIIPLLTTPQKGRNFVFEVIAPSLPGYGFSDAAARPGLGAAEMAVVFKNLMKRLNFDKFYVQGGDWGAIIITHMSVLFPKTVIAMHSNMCTVMSPLSTLKLWLYSFMPSLIVEEKYQHLVYPISGRYANLIEETGYMHLQATKPDTVGTALNDSPAGLATYILEKFTTWTNPNWKNLDDGGLTKKFTMEDLLDNVMIYWITGSISTSMRLYAETFSKKQFGLGLDRIPVQIPSGCSRFIHDMVYSPNLLLEEKYPKLLQVTDHEGGHFAAFELPNELAKDVYDFIEKVLDLDKTQK